MREKTVLPADKAYAGARQIWNGAVNRFPAVFALCETADDVRAAIWCRKHISRFVTSVTSFLRHVILRLSHWGIVSARHEGGARFATAPRSSLTQAEGNKR